MVDQCMEKAPRASGVGMADRVELLQTFVAIVDEGSLSAAAVLLGTTQPTVSRRLQQLEAYFGLELLERSPQKFSITDDGQRCYDYGKEFLSQWSDFLS